MELNKEYFNLSPKQIEKLKELAGEEKLMSILKMDGQEQQLSKKQLKDLIEKAGEGAIRAALIQNGNTPVGHD